MTVAEAAVSRFRAELDPGIEPEIEQPFERTLTLRSASRAP